MEYNVPYDLGVELEHLAERLRAKKWMFGTAESCTGGMVAALCTSMPGSSEWFEGGVVSYANALKSSLLRVPQNLIAEYGAVSQHVAESMALGALDALSVDVAVSITGIAGPAGGTEEKPVGTVWVAVSIRHAPVIVMSRCFHFRGGRDDIRMAAAHAAVYFVLDRLTSVPAEG